MSVVSNASPLINLARISKLDLLREVYGELIIPEAVWHEVVVEGTDQPGADEVKTVSWIKRQAATNRQLVQALRQELDAGEAESIALALEITAELLLMDEHLGREVARHFGLRYTGLIGVFIEAKRKGLIHTVKPYLDSLRDIAGFHIGEGLYLRVLQDEEEV
jgi:predicted nucleic acid-binding protein